MSAAQDLTEIFQIREMSRKILYRAFYDKVTSNVVFAFPLERIVWQTKIGSDAMNPISLVVIVEQSKAIGRQMEIGSLRQM